MYKKITTPIAALCLALASASAMAAPFDYSYVEGGVGQLDEGSAVFVNGAMDLAPHWTLKGGLQMGQFDIPGGDLDYLLLQVGAQYHRQVNPRFSWHAGGGLAYAEVDGDFRTCIPGFGCSESQKFESDDVGAVAFGGVRFQIQPKLILEGDAKLFKNDSMADDGLGLQGALRYYVDPKLSVAGGLAIDTELDGLYISLRHDL